MPQTHFLLDAHLVGAVAGSSVVDVVMSAVPSRFLRLDNVKCESGFFKLFDNMKGSASIDMWRNVV